MRDYAKFQPRYWTSGPGKKFRGDGNTQLVGAYLFTAPTSNMLGIYYLPKSTVAHDLGLSIEGASKALRTLSEGAFCSYDDETEMIWVHEMARIQVLDKDKPLKPKDKRVKGVQRELLKYKDCVHFQPFIEHYREELHLENLDSAQESKGPLKPLPPGAEAPSKQGEGKGEGKGEGIVNNKSGGLVVNEDEKKKKKNSRRAELEKACERVLLSYFTLYEKRDKATIAKGGSAWKRVMARLLEGYSEERLNDALLGGRHNPAYWDGDNDRNIKYRSIETILRDSGTTTKHAEWWDDHKGSINGQPLSVKQPPLMFSEEAIQRDWDEHFRAKKEKEQAESGSG